MFGSVDRVNGVENVVRDTSQPERSVPARFAPVRSTPASVAPRRCAPLRTASRSDAGSRRSHPVRSAPARFVSPSRVPVSVAGPGDSCSTTHAVPTPGRQSAKAAELARPGGVDRDGHVVRVHEVVARDAAGRVVDGRERRAVRGGQDAHDTPAGPVAEQVVEAPRAGVVVAMIRSAGSSRGKSAMPLAGSPWTYSGVNPWSERASTAMPPVPGRSRRRGRARGCRCRCGGRGSRRRRPGRAPSRGPTRRCRWRSGRAARTWSVSGWSRPSAGSWPGRFRSGCTAGSRASRRRPRRRR